MSVLAEIREQLDETARKLRAWQAAWEKEGEAEPARAYLLAAEALEEILGEHFRPIRYASERAPLTTPLPDSCQFGVHRCRGCGKAFRPRSAQQKNCSRRCTVKLADKARRARERGDA